MSDIFFLILAGGAGTRFWPASRASRPKQLLPLSGAEPLILETARRVLPLALGWGNILVASGRHLVEPTSRILPDLPKENLLVEPVARNTAPCIGWAVSTVLRRNPNAILVVLPSDHHIGDPDGFRKALRDAIASAERGAITTIGISPTHAETGFGYIEVGDTIEGAPARAVVRFVEKPNRERAEEFVASGRFLWNAGMFIFRARDMLRAIEQHLPALAQGMAAIDLAAAKGAEEEAVSKIFPTLPAVSIDKGVIEHTSGLAVVPGYFGWSDVGSWQSAWELGEKDAAKNTSPKGAILVEAYGNHVVDLRSPDPGPKKRVIALVGVSDLVVVETDDALLIVPRERAQDVREVVDRLKKRGDEDLT
jgi:mannose-1-phosphate guanylyltransferase